MAKDFYPAVGVDTGGTFTDLVLIDDKGAIHSEKSFSIRNNPATGILNTLATAADNLACNPSDILSKTDNFCHGTTVSTNILITRNGAKVGVLFTNGFEDTLHIGRGPIGRVGGLPQSLAMDFIHTEPGPPLVLPEMVKGLPERVDVKGDIVQPLNLIDARKAILALAHNGAQSLAICLLWSFKNPRHEQQVIKLCKELVPEIPLSVSHEIAPRIGEFERAVATVVNAYVGPATTNYIRDLNRHLINNGLKAPLRVMSACGGAIRVEEVNNRAVSMINSGPVAGLVAAQYLGKQLGDKNIITADMGGTSFDVGLINENRLEEDPQPFLDQGLPVNLPAIKLVTIGAGGGSIAWSDGYRLFVGPQSAGAEPGPAAYGRGGLAPTVTDALIVCGIIDPDYFFGGTFTLDPGKAEKAISDNIGKPLNLSTEDAAAGILEIVNARMANLIRKVSIESGHDPSDFSLYAYGGGTGAHCAEFARQLGIGKLILPYAGPVFSALGVAIADIIYTRSQTGPAPLNRSSVSLINRNFTNLNENLFADIKSSGHEPSTFSFKQQFEMRYVGQMNELALIWDQKVFEKKDVEILRKRFEQLYQTRFGEDTARPDGPIELTTFRVDATKHTPPPPLKKLGTASTPPREIRKRQVYIRGKGAVEATVVNFEAITQNSVLVGPIIIERDTTTIWIPEKNKAMIDKFGNVIIEINAG